MIDRNTSVLAMAAPACPDFVPAILTKLTQWTAERVHLVSLADR